MDQVENPNTDPWDPILISPDPTSDALLKPVSWRMENHVQHSHAAFDIPEEKLCIGFSVRHVNKGTTHSVNILLQSTKTSQTICVPCL